MEEASQVATWLSLLVTTVGLGGLVTQASEINNKMDPFHSTRNSKYLGIWFRRQQRFPWWVLAKPPPLGPIITARGLEDGFCGYDTVHITRIPLAPTGSAGWSVILGMLNSEEPTLHPPLKETDVVDDEGLYPVKTNTATMARDSTGWNFLQQTPLVQCYEDTACIRISRATLITMLVATNGRPVFKYSEAVGYRAGFASYCGQWYVTWPIGKEAIVKFVPHDSFGSGEVFPRSFPHRIGRCCQILCGIAKGATSGLNVAFCGRKSPGKYVLEHAPSGFQNAHGARHLYNMLGGRAYEVDFMSARAVDAIEDGMVVLNLPSTEKGQSVMLGIKSHEESIIKLALDSLPWSALSWSIHRGMRDILVAYAKPVMDMHRAELAERLKKAVTEHSMVLCDRGWDAEFVRTTMANMAASAVMAGKGNSGDAVRVVSDVVSVMLGGWSLEALDEVNFWRRPVEKTEAVLDVEAIVALTKVFVLEWSVEFDYQMYHQLPVSLYFG